MLAELSSEILAEVLAAGLDSGDRNTLPEGIVAALKRRNCFSLLLPRSLGGNQMDYPDYVRLVQAVATADGSAGWCVNQGSVLASLARLLPAREEIWHKPNVSLANGPPLKCFSSAVSNGYSLTGTWTFSSGIDHADWLIGVAPLKENGQTRAILWHFLPKQDATIDEAAWAVNGLRATGSFQFSVAELFVPASHVLTVEVREDDAPLYQIPLNLLFAGGFSAVALGVSRAALDFAEQRLQRKIKRFDKQTMNLSALTQSEIALSEAMWQANEAYLHQTIEAVWGSITKLGVCTFENKVKLRLAATHVIRESKKVTDAAYDLCSTDSIFKDQDIQRRFQDMHVISQHLQGRPDIYALVGKYYLGLDAASDMLN